MPSSRPAFSTSPFARRRLERAGYALTAGFPVWLAARFAERALRSGVGVVTVRLVAASPYPTRTATALLVPAGAACTGVWRRGDS